MVNLVCILFLRLEEIRLTPFMGKCQHSPVDKQADAPYTGSMDAEINPKITVE